jgi:tetraprenyl-beta-curcumene synthase
MARASGAAYVRLGLGDLKEALDRSLPVVSRELVHWEELARQEPHPWARELALDSLRAKRFHCESLGVLAALAAPGAPRGAFLRAAVAVQTLSDLLDSWTDRPPTGRPWPTSTILDMHAPLVAAVGLLPLGGAGQMGGGRYVASLVACAHAHLRRLPGYGRVRGRLLALAWRYALLQALKHGPQEERSKALREWQARLPGRQGLPWPVGSAADGSTLAMFHLLAWASHWPAPPWPPRPLPLAVGALHILLDGVVDGPEDAQAGDLNLFAALGSPREGARCLYRLMREAAQPRYDPLAPWWPAGLVATYLSDPKGAQLPRWLRLSLWGATGVRGWLVARYLAHLRREGRLAPRLAQCTAAPLPQGKEGPSRGNLGDQPRRPLHRLQGLGGG